MKASKIGISKLEFLLLLLPHTQLAISSIASLSNSWLIVAITPSMNNFLIISDGSRCNFFASSATVSDS